MVKQNKLKIAIISLLIALAVVLSAAFSILFGRSTAYAAEGRYIELSNSIFYRSIRGAQIVESDPIADGSDEHRYAKFIIGKDQEIAYRRDLAYSWLKGARESEAESYTVTNEKFSMEFSFVNLNFKRYIIALQSQQYVLTEDGITENFLVFEPIDSGNHIRVLVTSSLDNLEKDEEDNYKGEVLTVNQDFNKDHKFKISFGDYKNGEYQLKFNDEVIDAQIKISNVYEGYASYVASGDNAVTPLTFKAEFADDAEADATAEMLLYSINGQSFEMFQNGGSYKVKDNVSPVICFSETPSYLKYGETVSFKYKAIDVLGTTVRAIPYYYVLSGEQYKNENGDFLYEKYDYSKSDSSDTGSGDSDTEDDGNPFFKITSTSSVRIIRDENSFIPRDMLDTNVYGLVKIYYELSDYSGTLGNKEVVFVDWYAKDDALVDLAQLKHDGPSVKFIKLIETNETKAGATFAKETDTTEEAYKTTVGEFQQVYQDKINAVIKNSEDEKLYAGGDSKLYLPAIEYDFFDEYFTGKDYKYTIYYKVGSNKNNTAALESNKLAISLNEADKTYMFTIFVTDSLSDNMRYPKEVDAATGEVVWGEITKDDIWDEDKLGLLPYFEFNVSYKEATAEDATDLTPAYVGTNYSGITSSSFKLDAQTGTFTANYNLYVFDRNAYMEETGKNLEYEEFIKRVGELFNGSERKFFTTVKEASKLLENDPNYEDMKALNWNSTNITFTPRSIDDFYVIELVLTSNRSQIETTHHAVIAASVETTALKGESDWAKNNVASIVLLSVAGVCLIAFIVLLIVKPKDKGDIDAVYTEVSQKGKDKKKKDKNTANKLQ